MSVKIVASWQTLIHLAHELGRARMSGDHSAIKGAKAKHDEYVEICRQADQMILPTGSREAEKS